MGDRCGDDYEQESKEREDLEMRRKPMYRTMAVNVEAFTGIVPMMMLLMGVRLRFDWKVDCYLPFLARVLKIANATTKVTLTPMIPLRPTLRRSFSRPEMP